MADDLDRERVILQQTSDEVLEIGEQWEVAPLGQGRKSLRKQFDRKMEVYSRQLKHFQEQFPGVADARIFEASYYSYQATSKILETGILRLSYDKMQSGTRKALQSGRYGTSILGTTAVIGTGFVAQQQEKANARQALTLLDKSISLADIPGFHLKKAIVYHVVLKQNDDAVRELNYIITEFPDDETYFPARQLRDEILTPKKKSMCFIATAAYGSPLAPQVLILSDFRDHVLLESRLGEGLVGLYYHFSPPIARLITRRPLIRSLLRIFMLRPLVGLVKFFWLSRAARQPRGPNHL